MSGQYLYSSRPTTAPMHRSKIANIFGTRPVAPGVPLAPGVQGFVATPNGTTMMTPRGAVMGYSVLPSPRGYISPRQQVSAVPSRPLPPSPPQKNATASGRRL